MHESCFCNGEANFALVHAVSSIGRKYQPKLCAVSSTASRIQIYQYAGVLHTGGALHLDQETSNTVPTPLEIEISHQKPLPVGDL